MRFDYLAKHLICLFTTRNYFKNSSVNPTNSCYFKGKRNLVTYSIASGMKRTLLEMCVGCTRKLRNALSLFERNF